MTRRLTSIPDDELIEIASGIEGSYDDAKAAAQYHHMMRSQRAQYWRLQQRIKGQQWARYRTEIIRRKLWLRYYRERHYHADSRSDRSART